MLQQQHFHLHQQGQFSPLPQQQYSHQQQHMIMQSPAYCHSAASSMAYYAGPPARSGPADNNLLAVLQSNSTAYFAHLSKNN